MRLRIVTAYPKVDASDSGAARAEGRFRAAAHITKDAIFSASCSCKIVETWISQFAVAFRNGQVVVARRSMLVTTDKKMGRERPRPDLGSENVGQYYVRLRRPSPSSPMESSIKLEGSGTAAAPAASGV